MLYKYRQEKPREPLEVVFYVLGYIVIHAVFSFAIALVIANVLGVLFHNSSYEQLELFIMGFIFSFSDDLLRLRFSKNTSIIGGMVIAVIFINIMGMRIF